jgi:hypothetical protein
VGWRWLLGARRRVSRKEAPARYNLALAPLPSIYAALPVNKKNLVLTNLRHFTPANMSIPAAVTVSPRNHPVPTKLNHSCESRRTRSSRDMRGIVSLMNLSNLVPTTSLHHCGPQEIPGPHQQHRRRFPAACGGRALHGTHTQGFCGGHALHGTHFTELQQG